MVNPASPLQPGDSRLVGPIYTQGKFVEIMWDEFRRVAHPPRGPSIQRTWGPTLAILDLLRHRVAGQGRRLMIALYPSVLQVYPEARERLERELRQHPEHRRGTTDRRRSTRAEPSRARVLSSRGARLPRHDAGSHRGGPAFAGAAVQGAGHALDDPGQSRRGREPGPLAGTIGVPGGARGRRTDPRQAASRGGAGGRRSRSSVIEDQSEPVPWRRVARPRIGYR